MNDTQKLYFGFECLLKGDRQDVIFDFIRFCCAGSEIGDRLKKKSCKLFDLLMIDIVYQFKFEYFYYKKAIDIIRYLDFIYIALFNLNSKQTSKNIASFSIYLRHIFCFNFYSKKIYFKQAIDMISYSIKYILGY